MLLNPRRVTARLALVFYMSAVPCALADEKPADQWERALLDAKRRG